jgi:hypothetical protein
VSTQYFVIIVSKTLIMNKKYLLCAAGLSLVASLSAGDPLKDSLATDIKPSTFYKRSYTKSPPQSSFDDEVKNVIKLNLSHLIFPSVHLQYERVFHKNMSGALGFSYMPNRAFPNLILEGNAVEDPYYNGTTFGHWSITPEFRYYFGKKEEHNTPHGFYAAAYLRYEKYNMSSEYEYIFASKSKATLNITTSYGGPSFGFMIGSQFRITRNFYFDWWIIGASVWGAGTLEMEGKATGIALNPAEQKEVKETIEENFGQIIFLGGKPTVNVTANSFKASVDGGPMVSYRGLAVFGLCLGYAF